MYRQVVITYGPDGKPTGETVYVFDFKTKREVVFDPGIWADRIVYIPPSPLDGGPYNHPPGGPQPHKNLYLPNTMGFGGIPLDDIGNHKFDCQSMSDGLRWMYKLHSTAVSFYVDPAHSVIWSQPSLNWYELFPGNTGAGSNPKVDASSIAWIGAAGTNTFYAAEGRTHDFYLCVPRGVLYDKLQSLPDAHDLGSTNNTVSFAHYSLSGVTADLTDQIISQGYGHRVYFNIQNFEGTRFNDTLIGDEQDNRLRGGAGMDILNGRGGNNLLNGGTGWDFVNYGEAPHAVYVNLELGSGVNGYGGFDRLLNIESANGSNYDDILVASNHVTTELFGEDGNDRLLGGSGINGSVSFLRGGRGEDHFFAGTGRTIMTGGGETDTFSFSNLNSQDVISDFIVGEISSGGDQLDFHALFSGHGLTGIAALQSIRMVVQGNDTIVQVNFADHDTPHWQGMVTLQGVHTTLDQLNQHHQIIT